jgi:hypothetical protein
MLQDVAQQIIGQFARNLQTLLQVQQPVAAIVDDGGVDQPTAEPAPAPRVGATPIGGFGLILRVLLNSLLALFKRK